MNLAGAGALEDFARRFLDVLPHARALGMQVLAASESQVEIGMDWNAELVGNPRSGVLHGGVVSALMDTSCGLAVLLHPDRPGGTATIDLRIDYMRGATPGQRLRARAECSHVTRAVAFVRAVALDDDEARPVATAAGAFTVQR